MAKNVHNDVLDQALNYIKNNANKLFVLTSEPTGASAYTNMTKDKDSSGFRLADSSTISSVHPGPGRTSER